MNLDEDDVKILDQLLGVLRRHGIRTFSVGGYSMEFAPAAPPAPEAGVPDSIKAEVARMTGSPVDDADTHMVGLPTFRSYEQKGRNDR